MKVKYQIKRLQDGRYELTDSTDSCEVFWNEDSAKQALLLWKMEEKHRNKSYNGTAKERAKIALAFMRFGDTDSRVFDNCFEMGDGEIVEAHLAFLARNAGIKYSPQRI